jgi:chloride channel 7
MDVHRFGSPRISLSINDCDAHDDGPFSSLERTTVSSNDGDAAAPFCSPGSTPSRARPKHPPGVFHWDAAAYDRGSRFDYEAAVDRDPAVSEYRREIEKGKRAGIFTVGRDFKPVGLAHRWTAQERAKMAEFEGLDYHEAISKVYRHHLEVKPPDWNWLAKWSLMAFVALIVGIIAFVLKQSIDSLHNLKIAEARSHFVLADKTTWWRAGLVLVSLETLYIAAAAAPVVFLIPQAAGSGIPEVMAYLNGVLLPKVFNLRTLCAKLWSCAFAVASGLPVGPEGPMIHLGAMVGAGVSQGRSRTLGFAGLKGELFFKRFRNNKDHRDFIAAGSAAGVAAAFAAPIGGLLFVMEEMASWWDNSLTWMIFFTCMVTCFSLDWFSSLLGGFEMHFRDPFRLKLTAMIHFAEMVPVPPSVLAIIPAFLLGLIGGATGTVFTWLNIKAARFRARAIRPSRMWAFLEPVLLVLVYCTAMYALPLAWPCRPIPDFKVVTINVLEERSRLVTWICPTDQYSPFASLAYGSTEQVVTTLFSHKTPGLYPYSSLAMYLLMYFFFACYTAGCSIASGLVIPMIIMGACMGRIMGQASYDVVTWAGFENDWVDPGLFAFIGAGAFFAGVSRLTISLTVIMLELTGSLSHLFPLMTAIMVAKSVADQFTHPLYHALLEVKCIPFLDPKPHVEKLDLFTVGHVMAQPVVTLCVKEKVRNIVEVLEQTDHNAFPVVLRPGSHVLVGLITRGQLEVILSLEESVVLTDADSWLSQTTEPEWWYNEMLNIKDSTFLKPSNERVPPLTPRVLEATISLASYMNCSPYAVADTFSLSEAYVLFRTMGLRHLLVVNGHEVVGMITRKDLLGQNIQERLELRPQLTRAAAPSITDSPKGAHVA